MGLDIYEICNISEGDLRRLFLVHKTVTKVASVLGVSRKTVGKHARALGIPTIPHRPVQPGRPRLVSGYGPVVRWLKANPSRKLPQNLTEAARIIGVSRKILYSYLKYRRDRFNEYLAKMPSLSSLDRVVSDTEGRPVPLKRISEAEISIDIKTMQVIIKAKLGAAARVTIKMPLDRFENLFRIQRSNDSR